MLITTKTFNYNFLAEKSNPQRNNNIISFKSCAESKQPYVFVAMPMTHKKWDNLHTCIKQIANTKNMKAERVDDILKKKMSSISSHSIKANIFESIDKSDMVIADISEPNPNVYFELGYAMGKGKKILPIALKGTKLPFDIAGTFTMFYKNRTNDFKEKFDITLDEYLNSINNEN